MIKVYIHVVYDVLIILLHRSIQAVKFLLKSVNLCKFMAQWTDVPADKLIPDLIQKFGAEQCGLYTGV